MPAQPPADDTRGMIHSLAGGVLNGLPIIGPAVLGAAERTAALLHTVTRGGTYADQLAQQQRDDAADDGAHPTASTIGGVTGGVLGTVPAMAAAPAAFGITSAGVVPNLLLGAAGGAVINTADAAARGGRDLDTLQRAAGTGVALGALGPAAGAAVGAGINRLANVVSRTTPAARNVANLLTDTGLTPADAQNALTRIGPSATLADIDPAFTTEAGGLAASGGRPTSILKNAMATRAGQADNRVSAALDQALGPKPDHELALTDIQDRARDSASPHYRAARASAAPMDISPVLSRIDTALLPAERGGGGAVGGEANALNRLRGYLTTSRDTPAGTMLTPKSDAGGLLKARQAMDDLLENLSDAETSAGRNAYRSVANVRADLDDVLKGNPNIAAGDAAYAGQMRIRDALNDGTQLFTKGVRPEDFARTLASASPEEVNAMRQGARIAIGDALDQARRGELSAAQSMFGRASGNRTKLDALFPQAGQVFDLLNGEAAMRATERSVAANSTTAERTAVQMKYRPAQNGVLSAAPAVIGEAMGGGPGAVALTAARAGYGVIAKAIGEGARNRLMEGTASGLAASGPAQRAFLDQVGRAYSTNAGANALAGGGSAATNLLIRGGLNPLLQQYMPQPVRR